MISSSISFYDFYACTGNLLLAISYWQSPTGNLHSLSQDAGYYRILAYPLPICFDSVWSEPYTERYGCIHNRRIALTSEQTRNEDENHEQSQCPATGQSPPIFPRFPPCDLFGCLLLLYPLLYSLLLYLLLYHSLRRHAHPTFSFG